MEQRPESSGSVWHENYESCLALFFLVVALCVIRSCGALQWLKILGACTLYSNLTGCRSSKGTNVSDSHRCRSSCSGRCLINMLGLGFLQFWCVRFSRHRIDNMLQETSFSPLTPCTSVTTTRSNEGALATRRSVTLGSRLEGMLQGHSKGVAVLKYTRCRKS
jgi:hypothetical protein